MKHPRALLAAVIAGMVVPFAAWLAVTAAASAPGIDSAQEQVAAEASPSPNPPIGSDSVQPQAAEGDRVTPVVEPSAAPSQSPTPDPLAVRPTPSTSPSVVESSRSIPSTSATPTPSVTPTPPATKESDAPSPRPSRTKKPSAKPSPAKAPPDSPAPREQAPRKDTQVKGSWAPPELVAGTNQLTFPVLTSGADVTITVACQPSRGCQMNGGVLTIEPGSSVTVTWSAPRTRTHTAWSTQRTFN